MQTSTHRHLDASMDATVPTITALDALFDADTALLSAARAGRITTAWIEAQRERLAVVRAILLAVHREQKWRNAELDAQARQIVRESMGCCLPLEDA